MQVFGKAEVHIREVDQDGDIGTLLPDARNQLSVAGVDAGDMAKDFGNAHNGNIFGADDAVLPGGFHLRSA
jgi:hypothetical protein